MLSSDDTIFINSIALKLADLYVHPETTNKLRITIVKEIVYKCH